MKITIAATACTTFISILFFATGMGYILYYHKEHLTITKLQIIVLLAECHTQIRHNTKPSRLWSLVYTKTMQVLQYSPEYVTEASKQHIEERGEATKER